MPIINFFPPSARLPIMSNLTGEFKPFVLNESYVFGPLLSRRYHNTNKMDSRGFPLLRRDR